MLVCAYICCGINQYWARASIFVYNRNCKTLVELLVGLALSTTTMKMMMIIIIIMYIIIIIMYIYHVLINTLNAHRMIHINLNMIFHTHVEHSPTKTIYIKYY